MKFSFIGLMMALSLSTGLVACQSGSEPPASEGEKTEQEDQKPSSEAKEKDDDDEKEEEGKSKKDDD